MDIDPEKRNGLLEDAILGGEETINGLTLRPVSAATWSLLSRMKNGFVTGQNDGDYAFGVYSFVFLHSRPLSEIRAKVATLDALVADVYAFMDTRPVEDLFAFVPWITSQMERIAATVTQAAPQSEGPKA